MIFFFKQKTAYEIYQCDWSSDVCSSDLLDIRKGTTAIAAGVAGVLISQAQLEANGGDAGGIAINAVDSIANTSGLYDFEISGLNPSISSANVVIPLPSALEANSVYRKYNPIEIGRASCRERV